MRAKCDTQEIIIVRKGRKRIRYECCYCGCIFAINPVKTPTSDYDRPCPNCKGICSPNPAEAGTKWNRL